MPDFKQPVKVIVVSCRMDEDDDVLGWRLESLLPDDWDVETVQKRIPESNEDDYVSG